MRGNCVEAEKLNNCIQEFELAFETYEGLKVLDSLQHGEPPHNEEEAICYAMALQRQLYIQSFFLLRRKRKKGKTRKLLNLKTRRNITGAVCTINSTYYLKVKKQLHLKYACKIF